MTNSPEAHALNSQIDLKNAETLKCKSCGGKLFTQVLVVKKVSKLVIMAPEDVPLAIPVFKCDGCGQVLNEFIPKGAGLENDLFPVKKLLDE